MRFSAFSLLPLLALADVTLTICPGFNYGIGNVQRGNVFNRWTIYDDNCNAVDSLTTTGNPCTSGIFGCSPPPIIFNRYTNSFTGLVYACRTDPRSGVCGNDVISVCCRNDGR
ncbi:hypothetical protein BDN72DRAFT_850388 [Pluteus cervinus]|uniref:Uncharacterized protein n=1 Tax=Pluteus cervinus TaxID=181527 RepID=A0ACD3A4J9_9AGAR|nr:hypothetical protein BDN72DRAFT_850388 [Pluteus cervinus]